MNPFPPKKFVKKFSRRIPWLENMAKEKFLAKDSKSYSLNIDLQVKGKNLCLKYFSEERVYSYIYNNMELLRDLNLNMFLLELFLLI